jgi:hypothetical protein
MKLKLNQTTRNVLNILLVVILGLALLWGKTSGQTGIPEDEGTIWDMFVTEEETVTEEPAIEETVIEETVIEETHTETLLETSAESSTEETSISEDGTYTSKEEVAEYLHIYGHLPSNFITKRSAKELGWISSEGNLWDVAPGMSIGGDYFGNYEGLLPEDREYTECDIDTLGKDNRGAKRIVFSDDGLIYYTDDHYKSFELLYGEP